MTNNKTDIQVCSCTIVHEDVVADIKNTMPDEEIMQVADVFKILSDSTRLRIICSLIRSEMCVCDLAAALNLSQSAVSHQLRALRGADMVKFRREGKTVYYSLDNEDVREIVEKLIDLPKK